MKAVNKSIIIFLAALSLSPPIIGQNFFIRVFDESSLQSIPDVRVILESQDSKVTVFTGARGDASSFIPAGVYTLIIEMRGYEIIRDNNIHISASEVLNTEYFLKRKIVISGLKETVKSQVQEEVISKQKPSVHSRLILKIINRERKGFIDVGYQGPNMLNLNTSIGIRLFKSAYSVIGYARGSQYYKSEYFSNPFVDNRASFNNVYAGIGYDFSTPLKSEDFGLYLNPLILFGGEFVKNNDLIIDNSIHFIANALIKPQIQLGIFYKRYEFYVGSNYSIWLSSVITEKRYSLHDSNTKKPIKWSGDLFHDRKGLNGMFGIRFRF